ncbi:NAD(P)H-binding protein [Streptomyces cacaoi]|uniref:Nucleotide-diphosphate-sugar epimerase n=1 Tax=Streptomyces cacaoi TaxID=1898 RepID=A0A4Y3R862_STRCI|nr:NAD(P)H-binding protein [Streptomyces cacaoi]NNG89146.1 NAD(P)H-binding protein [Streptomyces cacaoi]GEB53559.1 nucleotide-diphosphate-sugar epimerase [Streptomyces cacaoi]
MTILVTGATGTVGRILVDRLLSAGQRVRALTRDPARAQLPGAVEVVAGGLADGGAALDGVDRVFFLPGVLDPGRAGELTHAFLERAAGAGVRRVVDLTGVAVTVRRPGSFEMLREAEEAVERSGLEWTHVRPGEFARNKLDMWGPSIRAEGVVRSAFPDALGVPVHEADIAEVAAAALLEDGHTGRAYSLSGPERLSHREQAGALADGLGRRLRFEPLTYGQARAAYIASGIPADIAEYLLGYQAEYAEEPPQVLPDTERVLGRPGRTLARWAADHAAELPDETAGAHAV